MVVGKREALECNAENKECAPFVRMMNINIGIGFGYILMNFCSKACLTSLFMFVLGGTAMLLEDIAERDRYMRRSSNLESTLESLQSGSFEEIFQSCCS